jgi:hypothetical protein
MAREWLSGKRCATPSSVAGSALIASNAVVAAAGSQLKSEFSWAHGLMHGPIA